MDFTREPIIETIVTPRDGCKLVVRSSKSVGQEEYFVDAVEIVSFGHSLFFRSLERPKAFLVPVTDYEVLEVREARMVLKNTSLERSIKIAGGREGAIRGGKEVEKVEAPPVEELEVAEGAEQQPAEVQAAETRTDVKLDKKRERRRHYRKRRGSRGEEAAKEEAPAALPEENQLPQLEPDDKVDIEPPEPGAEEQEGLSPLTSSLLSSLLQPPPQLISETISRYRENFKSAFFLPEDEKFPPHDKVQELLSEDEEEEFTPPEFPEPTYEHVEEQSEQIEEEPEPIGPMEAVEETETVEQVLNTEQEESFELLSPQEEEEEKEDKAALHLFEEEEEPVLEGEEENNHPQKQEEEKSPH